MANYRTIHRKTLIEFLRSQEEADLSAESIAEGLKNAQAESAPSRSTVYRLLQNLAEEGVVRRSMDPENKQALYRISGENCSRHLHLKCERCGRIMHLEEESSKTIARILREKEGFLLNKDHNLFLGRCLDCQ